MTDYEMMAQGFEMSGACYHEHFCPKCDGLSLMVLPTGGPRDRRLIARVYFNQQEEFTGEIQVIDLDAAPSVAELFGVLVNGQAEPANAEEDYCGGRVMVNPEEGPISPSADRTTDTTWKN